MNIGIDPSSEIFIDVGRKNETIELMVRDDIRELDANVGPGITAHMKTMGGEIFEIDRRQWENDGSTVRGLGYNWRKNWLVEHQNILNQGEEL